MNHTNPIRDMAGLFDVPFETLGMVALWWRRKVWNQVNPKPIPSGTFTGNDWASRWGRVPPAKRALIYKELNALFDDMARLAAEERAAKGFADDYRW